MDKSARIEKFFYEERKFLNKHVDLLKVLKLEGWRPVPSRLTGISRFQHKGRIVDVIFHKGADAFSWTDDLGKSGSSLDLLKDEQEPDAKINFINALTKLRAYAKKLIPKQTGEFYKPYEEVLEMLKRGDRSKSLSPYETHEMRFLQSEVSIYKVAFELGYRAAPGAKLAYFRKGETLASFKRSEGNGFYLWYDPNLKKGGTILDFLAFEKNLSRGDAYQTLKEMAVKLVAPERLQSFLIKAYEITVEDLPKNSLRTMIETKPLSLEFQIEDVATHKRYILDLQEGYRRLPVFKNWNTTQVAFDILPRHFRIPELNPAFKRVESELGVEETRELTRIVLLLEASKNISNGTLSQALSDETLKSDVSILLGAIKAIQRDPSSPGIEPQKIRSIVGRFKLQPSKELTVDVNDQTHAHGLGM